MTYELIVYFNNCFLVSLTSIYFTFCLSFPWHVLMNLIGLGYHITNGDCVFNIEFIKDKATNIS